MNKLLKPLIVLLALAGVWAVVQITGRDPARPDADKALTVDVDTSGISRLAIARGEDTVTVEHGVGGWTVQTPAGPKPADAEAVRTALNNLNDINTTDVISHNPEKREEFRVDDASGTHVMVYGPAGDEVEHLVIGKLGGYESQQMAMAQGRINESQFHSYIRRSGADNVYKVRGFFGGMMAVDTEQWRDHDVMKFHPQQLRGVSLAWDDTRIELELDSVGEWQMSEPQPPDGMVVDTTALFRLASALGSFRASGFVDSTVAETGFDQPTMTVQAELVDGTSYDVTVGREIPDSQNLFYCRRADREQIYTMAEFRLDQLKKTPEELLTEAPTEEEAAEEQ